MTPPSNAGHSSNEAAVQADGPNRFILRYPPRMDLEPQVSLVAALQRTVGAQPVRELILSLAGVNYINSVGLGAIFTLRKHIANGGGRMVLCDVGPGIDRLLKIVNMPALIPLLADVDEARGYLERQDPPEQA